MSGFVWFEYVTSDAAQAQGFFGELFHWGVRPVPMPQGSYEMIASGERTIGGYAIAPSGAPAAWRCHLAVADAKAGAARAAALGGAIVRDAIAVGDFGHMAIVRDPHGAELALWQPARPEPQPQPTAGCFAWTELMSADADASVAFYRALGALGHEVNQMGGGGPAYHLLTAGGVPRAGIMQRQEGDRPHAWMPYVQVASADDSVARARRLGAAICHEPTDIPGTGRFAILADAQGVATGVLQPAAMP